MHGKRMACNRINNLNSTICVLLHSQNLGKMYYFLYIIHTIHNSTYMFQTSTDNYTDLIYYLLLCQNLAITCLWHHQQFSMKMASDGRNVQEKLLQHKQYLLLNICAVSWNIIHCLNTYENWCYEHKDQVEAMCCMMLLFL